MAAPAHRLNLKKHRAPHERLTKSADRSGVGRAKQEWAKAQDRFTLTPNVLLIEAPHERLTKSADRSGVGRAKQEWAKAQDRFTLTPNVLLIEVQWTFLSTLCG